MGSSFSTLLSPCLTAKSQTEPNQTETILFNPTEPLDETLGHSFCYLRSSARFLSPNTSDRFVSPSHSLRFDEPVPRPRTGSETGFRAISGASVSANSYTPRTVLQVDNIYDSASDSVVYNNNGSVNNCSVICARGSANSSVVVSLNGFESTPSFSALPLQPVPRGGEEGVGGFFLSGPIERGAVSGPVEGNSKRLGEDVPFSAPLGEVYVNKRKKKKGPSRIRKAFGLDLMEKNRPWVVPVRSNFAGKKEGFEKGQVMVVDGNRGEEEENVEWALGKAGEDRVHVVVSEEQGWLFVGIYDGFNGPDAPEFLMSNLYRAVYHELQGLFWENVEEGEGSVDPNTVSMQASTEVENVAIIKESREDKKQEHKAVAVGESEFGETMNSQKEENSEQLAVKKVAFQSHETEIKRQRRKLWELLAEADVDEGLDLSGTERFAFSVDDAISVSNARSSASRRWLLLSKLKQGLIKQKDVHGRKLFPRKSGSGLEDDKEEKFEHVNRVEEGKSNKPVRRRIVGPVDHDLILRAMSRALEATELAYLDMTEKVLDMNPELALMGSCLLVVLMRDEDVYVMNLGDSRAIVAHFKPEEVSSTSIGEFSSNNSNDNSSCTEGIVEESVDDERVKNGAAKTHVEPTNLIALQLSTDHSTSIEEEVIRIQNEHPDDNNCIVNDRVKGRLKVTRAFGAGFLKQPKLNDALLEMFRNEYIGSAPYLSCCPSLHHHRLSSLDQFLVLSSDGLYQYLTNEEVVTHVQGFLEKYPDGDPAQHLIEELLVRAAKKAGMEFHELLDIPQGDRRKYHDDVTVMVVSLEGRIWKSSGKYL